MLLLCGDVLVRHLSEFDLLNTNRIALALFRCYLQHCTWTYSDITITTKIIIHPPTLVYAISLCDCMFKPCTFSPRRSPQTPQKQKVP